MAGNPANASVWPDADIYIAPEGTADPATVDDPFGALWGQVGLLDGEAGVVQSREEDVQDHYAWGGILVRTTRRNFKHTRVFTLLEDNPVTREIIWPGSTESAIFVPRPKNVKIGFEFREGSSIKREITALHGQVWVNGDITDAEADLTRYEMLATIFPDPQSVNADGAPKLFNVQTGAVLSS